ncbi:MAG TPA: cytidylate kinase family protein [Acidimicrobiales bacterium]
MLITVSGPPGSGTTTASRRIARDLAVELLPGGEVFRAMASERSLTLAAFGAYAAGDPAIDVELDSRLADRARKGDVVIESRLAGWIVRNEGLPAVATWVDCDARIRASRVAAREGITVERALADNAARQAVERERYLKHYGIDVDDLSIYDLVLDSGALSPGEIADAVVSAARARTW